MPAVCPGRQTIRSQTAEAQRPRALAIDRTEAPGEAQLGHTGATGERLTADNHGLLRSISLPDELASWA